MIRQYFMEFKYANNINNIKINPFYFIYLYPIFNKNKKIIN